MKRLTLILLALPILSATILPFSQDVKEEPYVKVINDIDPEAVCLDGSPAFLYIHQGSEPDKFLIYTEGLRVCQGANSSQILQSCYQRSKINRGSSELNPEKRQFKGILSTNPKNQFSTWTKVALGYCDGGAFLSTRKQPIPYKDSLLYFRGQEMMRAHLKWLIDNHQFSKATQVVVSGTSSGGITTYSWSNYIYRLLDHPQNLKLILESSLFTQEKAVGLGLDVLGISNRFLVATVIDEDKNIPIDECLMSKFQCTYLTNTYKQIKAPILIINSLYDAFMIYYGLMVQCITPGFIRASLINCNREEMAFIEMFRKRYQKVIEEIGNVQKNGVWAIACPDHQLINLDSYDNPEMRVPVLVGQTAADAVSDFMEGKKVKSIDAFPWPNNFACAY